MIPKEQQRTITLYIRKHIGLTGVHVLRRVLHGCSFEDDNISTLLRTGQVVDETVLVRIFDKTSGLQWIPPHEWHKADNLLELDGKWTADISDSPTTLVLPFESNHEFPVFTDTGLATREENTFARLPENTGSVRVVRWKDNSTNGKMGSHIRLRCNGKA